MDALAFVTLTVPIFFPVVMELGYDPIWFGIIIVMVTEMGVITPPVGINVYVRLRGVAPKRIVPSRTPGKDIQGNYTVFDRPDCGGDHSQLRFQPLFYFFPI